MPPTTAPIGPATTAPARAPPAAPPTVPVLFFFTSLVVVVVEPSGFSTVVVVEWSWAGAGPARRAPAAPRSRYFFMTSPPGWVRGGNAAVALVCRLIPR